MNNIKVTYINKNGGKSQAYVDETTLRGTDRHTDVEVWLEFREDFGVYMQIDDFEWEFDWEGTPYKKVNNE